MSQECHNCIVLSRARSGSSGNIRARLTVNSSPKISLSGVARLRPDNQTYVVVSKQKFEVTSNLKAKEVAVFNPSKFVSENNGKIKARTTIDGVAYGRVSSSAKFKNSFTNKIHGPFGYLEGFLRHNTRQSLFPTNDLETVRDGNALVNELGSEDSLYLSVDESVISELYDNSTYIYPSSIHTVGSYRYKCNVTNPAYRPEESYLLIRAIAPTNTNSSSLPPVYKFSNITLEDPSGNLIIKYKDFEARGDANYSETLKNYTTYITEPEVNYALLNTWEDNYPFFGSGYTAPNGYVLNIDIDVECLDDPFDAGFNFGYEENACEIKEVLNYNTNDYLALDGKPISTQSSWYQLNPRNNTILISAIEISNSGALSTLTSNFLPFYTLVSSSGLRINRTILPAQVLSHDYNTSVYPSVDSVWESTQNYDGYIIDNVSGDLTWFIRHASSGHYITLNDTEANGKLKLKFSHEPPVGLNTFTDGAFNFGHLSRDSEFKTARLKSVADVDNFFTIDSVELKVVAKKKDSSVPDYVLDVVGYSDDKLLNVTSAVGGFLQNVEGTGTIPASSGYYDIDELGISSEAISDKDAYFESNETNNDGGDHYKLATLPVINSTEFREYTIPLRIYEDNVVIGKSVDYSMSSYFEHLYLDLYPIPSGASIANIKLVVTYKPSNGITLHTLAHGPKEFENRDVLLLPSSGLSSVINSSGTQLSLIENIPHAYAQSGLINGEPTLKTNYSRRWRGVTGDKVFSDFNLDFDYSFEKEFLNYPFVNYYDFNNVTSSSVLPVYYSAPDNTTTDTLRTITLMSSGDINIVQNIGSRFKTTSLFSSDTDYQTIDWTSITGYEDDLLYGKIADSFDSAIRLSSNNSYLYTYNIERLSRGFAAFIRFSPDVDVSGVGYNLFNSGVIFGECANRLSFALAFNNGYLTVYGQDQDNNIISIQDTITYSDYSYPISVAVTYSEEGDGKLRLYTDNEIVDEFTNLRATSSSFEIDETPENALTVGFSPASGVGMNMFVSDFGIMYFDNDEDFIGKTLGSDFANLFDDIRMPFAGQDSRYKLWQRIDQDADTWHLGAYNICHFNREFDRFTHRVGSDYIFHRLKHHGSGYAQICDLELPSNIPSGLAYHTQIENDMLRFHLGASAGTFKDALYSPLPRINKSLPRGYNFEEEAFVVETIIEHDTFDDIVWEDGSIGPRLIVSLYTLAKDPVSYDAQNYGLVNRHIHHLEPSGCFRKISSTFDSNSFLDEDSEPWSNFAPEKRLTEFNHKYFSKDIEDMFVQYDLAYPSGNAFDSTVKIHVANIRLKNALVESRDLNDQMNLHVSGQKVWREYVNLSMPYTYGVASSGLNLYSSGVKHESSGNLNFHVSGAVLGLDSMSLYSLTIGRVDNFGNDESLFGSYDPTFGLTLYVSGQKFDEKFLPLYLSNKLEDQSTSGTLSLVAYNKLPRESIHNSFSIFAQGSNPLEDFVPEARMNLVVAVDIPAQDINESINLYVNSYDPTVELANNSLSLFTVNYEAAGKQEGQSEYINWTSSNPGVGIELDDNSYAFLDADDEIRGVDITCYGSCNNGGTCREQQIITHETVWGDSDCIEGGIFRASNVYTNLEASGFNTDVGYSGHFYGIRKYVGLIPNAPYRVLVEGKTADGSIVNVPREMDTIEYGTNETVAYSGVKLIGDDPYAPSGRQEGDNYGKSVAVKGDLMVVGAPHHTIKDITDNDIDDAGAVFVYRRDPQPAGFEWEYDKAAWNFETKLRLPFPSGDYLRNEVQVPLRDSNGVTVAEVTERVWRVGQEGRQLGYSVDASVSGDRQIIVTGGPSAKWSRTFEELEPSGVNIGLFVFTDEFSPTYLVPGYIPPRLRTYENVLQAIKDKDLVFKYFASPFPVKFNVKVIICDCKADDPNYIQPEFPEPKPEGFVYTKLTHRHLGNEPANQGDLIYADIKSAFEEAFPYDTNELHNNIPAILGFHIDNSTSLGAEAIQPELDRFINYYKEYSLASGLVDFYNTPSEGGIAVFEGSQENWINESIDILNHVLNITRLKDDDQVRFFAESLDNFNTELGEFNDPPPSGGAVYVFENEEGDWNLIQTIESSLQSNIVAPDRFGHDVKISDNGEVIVVGSPYTSDAVTVYQYDPSEKQRMYNNVDAWVTYHRNTADFSSYYYNLKDRYDDLVTEYGKAQAAIELYRELTPEAKYDLRSNYLFWQSRGGGVIQPPNYNSGYYQQSKTGPIQEYEKIYTYGYGNIPYYGTWGFALERFAPTSRLGYSVAVNQDGSIVAAGAPTDSLNEYDDRNAYYFQNESATTRQNMSTWPSYVNAGAVRLFESRKYFPHNLAIEYGKFGNLGYERREEGTEQFYTHLSGIYHNVINRNTGERISFVQTPFSETEIPEEAGLMFIITPAINALSDEILTNIKEWLSLGDRHLVLVGDDPYYEADGAYAESTNIINNILSGLNSRLRIQPARNEYEAMVSGCPPRDKPNVVPSFKPTKSRITHGIAGKLHGYGAGDIKLYYPGALQEYECTLSKDYPEGGDYSYQSANGKANMPLVHYGDLRAEWKDYCNNIKGDKITFAQNWAMFFGTVVPENYGCYVGENPTPRSATYGYDPVPILAGAEYPPPKTIVYPAVPPASSYLPVEWESVPVSTIVSAKFGSVLNDEKQFAFSADLQDYTSFNRNIGSNQINPGQFFDPAPYNLKDPVLQATGISRLETKEETYAAFSPCVYAARENNIYLIAGLHAEDVSVLEAGDDRALNFWKNILALDYPKGTRLHVAQLGGWTGRTSFVDAYEDSVLATKFNNLLHTVDQNITSEELLNSPKTYEFDVCWIANPIGLPNALELKNISDWLALGDKKIIITYETEGGIGYGEDPNNDRQVSYNAVNNAKELCRLLNSTMKPIYLTGRNRFALNTTDGGVSDYLDINRDSFVSTGYPDSSNDNIERLLYNSQKAFVPIDRGNGEIIASFPVSVSDIRIQEITFWQMKTGAARLTLPVIPNSGYKIFVDLAAENGNESQPIVIDVSDCSITPKIGGAGNGQSKEIITGYNDQDEKETISDTIGYTFERGVADFYDGTISTISQNIQVGNTEEIDIYFSSNNLRINNNGYVPRTSRIISVSGCLVEIVKSTTTVYETVPSKYDWVITSEGSPEQVYTFEQPPREISTDNTKYVYNVCTECGNSATACQERVDLLGGQLIADGPVVAAEELEQFSSFEYGENRSRITVISDSSLIQGPCIADENGVISSDLIRFLESLYPPNPSNFVTRGRQFTISNKIISPERASPHKLYNASNNLGHILRFDGGETYSANRDMDDFDEYEYVLEKDYINGQKRPYELKEALEYDFTIKLPEGTKRTEEEIRTIEEGVISQFIGLQDYYGGTSKFSGIIEGKMYADANYMGGIPEIMTDTGYDYLDFARFPSGYPGDLFGYSIDLYDDKLIVGAPFVGFSGEYITPWSGIQVVNNSPSGMMLGFNGGAGAVYIFERTGNGVTPQGNQTNWQCTRKLRPNSINAGQDISDLDLSTSGFYLGDNNYTADDITNESIITDQFGYSVSIDADILAVGAPGHDFENYVEESGAAFINKAFGSSLNIPYRKVWDVGQSGVRDELFLGGSGTTAVLNNGAVYVFENRIYDWINKYQKWEFVEKIVQQGYKSRLQREYAGFPLTAISGSENDYFGHDVYVDRAKRSDGDYTIVVGTPYHKFATSGNHTTGQPLLDAGASYAYDAMLRERPASKADPNTFIQAKVFGDGDNEFVRLGFANGDEYGKRYEASGVIYSNNQGEIFIEVSGQDPVLKGFIQHRPYITSVKGGYLFGNPEYNVMRLFAIGQPPVSSGDISLYTSSDLGTVYNTVGLYEQGIVDFSYNNLYLYTESPSGSVAESGLSLYVRNGINNETLNLRVRGK